MPLVRASLISEKTKTSIFHHGKYSLIEMYHKQNVLKLPLSVQNTQKTKISHVPWYRDGVKIGSYMPTSIAAQLPGLEMIENSIINHTKLRQRAPGQIDPDGRDISGFYVVSDVGGVWLFKDAKSSYKWARSINRSVAPSIAWILSGKDMVQS